MKKLLYFNPLIAIIFVIILKMSGPCVVISNHYEESFGWPKIYGIEILDIEISWQVLLIIMIALMIVYLITLFKILLTIVKFKKLSLKLPKNHLILIFLGLFVVIASVTITVFEREEYVDVGMETDGYKFIIVDEHNKGYVVLKGFNGETTRMKVSSKAIEFIHRANSEERAMGVYYRRNTLLQTEYRICGMVPIWRGYPEEPFYYAAYSRRRMDYGTANPLHEKIYIKYLEKNINKIERSLIK